jgi:hypothetical protein
MNPPVVELTSRPVLRVAVDFERMRMRELKQP